MFSSEKCDALFAALLVDDKIDLDVRLPIPGRSDYTQDQLNQCYQISHQLWQEGLNRLVLSQMIDKISLQGRLNDHDQYAYYCMRAKIKHLRFAYALFGKSHRYPIVFNLMAAAMGYLQDVLKSPQRASLKPAVFLTRLFLSKPFYAIATKEVNGVVPTTPVDFRLYLAESIDFIEKKLIREKLTSHEFHEIRKVISRLVAFYDCIYVLYPSDYEYAILLYLSTINGLMGSLHDELIVAMFNKTQNYYKDNFSMPDEIKERLMSFIDFYKSSACA